MTIRQMIEMKNFVVYIIFALVGCASCEYSEPVQILAVSKKHELGNELKNFAVEFLNTDLQYLCRPDLSAADTRTIGLFIRSFQKCFNSTIDSFINQIDDYDFGNYDRYSTFERVVLASCALYDNAFSCLEKFSPAIDLCIAPEYLHVKAKLFSIAPLLHNAMCKDNGRDLVLLLQHHKDLGCVERATEKHHFTQLIETVLASNEEEIFSTEATCRELHQAGENVGISLGQCSDEISEIVKRLMFNLCDSTICNQVLRQHRCIF